MTPPSNGELWHLSIDDLLGPLPETFRLGGSGPFVINLRASNMSMNPIPHVLQGFDDLHLYQIQRLEDDVLRFRLRLGPFASEDAADAVLLAVRDSYPCALTATAAADDLQAIDLLQKPKAFSAQSNVSRSAPAHALPAAAPLAPVRTVPVLKVPVLEVPALAVPTRVAAASKAPVTIAAPTVTKPPIPSPSPAPTPAPAPAPVQLRKIAPVPQQVAASNPPPVTSFDATATVRRLTPAELSAAQSLRWFVIELSVTDHAVDPEMVPNLDIYDLYRLYSVTEVLEGRRVHALRLGFFSEEIAAKAVAAYLAGYYDQPAIKRVSVAERERFSQQGIEARKDVGATGMHSVIEITGDRHARPARKPNTPPP